jgi:error-prone DNA polymerase
VPDPAYWELRCRSAFSFLRGASLPEDIAARAAELGYRGVALGDLDGLYGAPRFWKSAQSHGLRALVAADVGLSDGRLLLLVESSTGYRNLCRLLTLGHALTPKGRTRVTLEQLEEHASGLVCLAGGGESPLVHSLERNDLEAAERWTRRLAGVFPDRLWIDVQRSLEPGVERRTRSLRDLAETLRIPLVASGDVRSARAEEQAVLDVFRSLEKHTTLDRIGDEVLRNAERFLIAPDEIRSRFRDLPGAFEAVEQVADRCSFRLCDLGYRFPEFPLEVGESPFSRLRDLTEVGARERYGVPLSERVAAQLAHELEVIGKLDLAGYFLIVWDIIRFCRERGILVQGRGSAANSAVCYALGITAVDAVGMELLFERFLSEERGEWPDIDLDLPSGDQREAVIQYVYRRYGGSESAPSSISGARTVGAGVAMTANVITYRTRSALREVGKVLGFAPTQIDRLSKLLAQYGFHDHSDSVQAQLRAGGVDVGSPRVRKLVHCVQALQGLPRHLGQHSGGMIVAAGRLDEVVPLEPASMPGRSVVQWDKDDCADLGMIKIDLLGLGMMAVLEEAIPLARRTSGKVIDLASLPPDDPATYAMIQKADTIGVFQIESRAQMATLPRLKPTSFYDLVVEVAIIRPGPIVGEMVHPYLNRRAKREEVRYPHPTLEPILRRTLGVPLFQEQLLRIAMTAAGFTGGEAEELRRAMAFKRSVERMREIEARLRQGLTANGIVGDAAEEIVRGITSFAMYGFPESHAASFALLAYASAYLKAHHPEAFLCALLNAWPMGFYHPATLVKDAQKHGVRVLPIDARRSFWSCTLEREERASNRERGARTRSPEEESWSVRLGLRFVAGLREAAANRLVQARDERPFRDVADLSARAMLQRREMMALAELGALGVLHGKRSRRSALWQVVGLAPPEERLLAGREPSPSAIEARPMSALEETLADYRASGITAGPHLLAHLRPELDRRGVLPLSALPRTKHGSMVTTAGLIIVRQRPAAAKGFCFLTLEDETGTGNAVITPSQFQRLRTVVHTSSLVEAAGRLEQHDGVTHLKVTRMQAIRVPGPTPPSHDFH